MIIGIDIGGTHTDGVLLKSEKIKSNSEEQYKIAGTSKVVTDQDNLMGSILAALDRLIQKKDKNKIERIVLSTTLATNTIQEEKYKPVGLILIPGPGLNPEYLKYGEENVILSGYIDHRGQVVKPLDEEEIISGLNYLQDRGLKHLAVVGKFSVRNPEQEKRIKEIIEEQNYDFQSVTLGHELSGNLNYYRRVITAYFNTAVTPTHDSFITAIERALAERNINADIYLLKCDGGTLPLEKSRQAPIKTVNSGPAASIMGSMTLSEVNEKQQTGIVLDIGGTTTDIGLFINGEPAFMPEGIEIKKQPTLIRGLFTVSIPVGGDSEIQVEEGQLKIGPQRKGPAAACGGPVPTPTDVLLVLGHIEEENSEINFDVGAARKALSPLMSEVNFDLYSESSNNSKFNSQSRVDLSGLAEIIIDQMAEKIEKTISKIIDRMRNQPVYTISELLESSELNPQILLGMGGPARAFVQFLARKLNFEAEVVSHSRVANAVGAAFAHPTLETTVRADTATGYLDIVEAGIHRQIKDKSFDINKAEELAREWTQKRAVNEGNPVEITDRESFNVIRGFRTLGKIMEVKAQIKPGQIAKVKEGGSNL